MTTHNSAEEWRAFPEDSRYEVSDAGHVRRWCAARGTPGASGYALRVCLAKPDTAGYCRINTRGDGSRSWLVHRMVAITFIPREPGKPFVLHGDGNPANNAKNNLRWGTSADNVRDAQRHGTHFKIPACPRPGETNGAVKLSVDAVARVFKLRLAGATQLKIGEMLGVSQGCISQLLRGATWRSVDGSDASAARAAPSATGRKIVVAGVEFPRIKDAAAHFNVSTETFRHRRKRGFSIEQAFGLQSHTAANLSEASCDK